MQFVSDIDEIIRKGKKPLTTRIKQSLFRSCKNEFFITGAPLLHVPEELFLLPDVTILTEHGGVMWKKGRVETLMEINPIQIIKTKLGIVVEDGFQEIEGMGSGIIEGPRLRSLTILFGSPLHYHPFKATADRETLKNRIQTIIREGNLPVSIFSGEDETYTWLDLILTTKRKTIQRLIDNGVLFPPFVYLGDKQNDLQVMQLEGVFPVAFPNCIPEIIFLARQKGIFIPYLPYEEGIPKLFDILNEGKL